VVVGVSVPARGSEHQVARRAPEHPQGTHQVRTYLLTICVSESSGLVDDIRRRRGRDLLEAYELGWHVWHGRCPRVDTTGEEHPDPCTVHVRDGEDDRVVGNQALEGAVDVVEHVF